MALLSVPKRASSLLALLVSGVDTVVLVLAHHEQRSTVILKYTRRMKNSAPFNGLVSLTVHRISSWGHVNPIGIRACYDEGKRVSESLTYSFYRQNGVEVRVARIFNTFGKSTHVCKLEL